MWNKIKRFIVNLKYKDKEHYRLRDDIKNKVINYKMISYKKKEFPVRDIVVMINTIKDILSKDLLEIRIPEYRVDKLYTVEAKLWFLDNGLKIDKLHEEIEKLMDLYVELKDLYNILIHGKKGNTVTSFNLRVLEPYIINIEIIGGELLKDTL